MSRRLALVLSSLVLAVAAVVAVARDDTSSTVDEVVAAFAAHGYALAEPGTDGWTGYAPLSDRPEVDLLYPEPVGSAPF